MPSPARRSAPPRRSPCRATARRRWLWAVAVPVLWSLGWVVTTLAGVAVDEQFTVFGATGAVTVTALLGILLQQLLRHRLATTTTSTTTSGDPS